MEVESSILASFDYDKLKLDLGSSSTKRRVARLTDINSRLKNHEVGEPQRQALCRLLLLTYNLYNDRNSRKAARKCLVNSVSGPDAAVLLSSLTLAIQSEVAKPVAAPTSYFIFTEWTCALIQELVANNQDQLWEAHHTSLIRVLAASYERTLAVNRPSVKQAATTLVRRTIRCILKSKAEKENKQALAKILPQLCAQQSVPTSGNAPLIGVLAGVSARLSGQKEEFNKQKHHFFPFYVREFLSSRTRIARHLVDGLADVFESFVTLSDFETEISPVLEKTLLRSPEVVLSYMVAPAIHALPDSVHLSKLFLANLLKPLMSSTSSKSLDVRNGACEVFEALAKKYTDPQLTEKVLSELLSVIKQNKASSAEQKIALLSMISSLQPSVTISVQVAQSIGLLALKEANDQVLDSQIRVLAKYTAFALQLADQSVLDQSVASSKNIFAETFSKGLTDNARPLSKRTWALAIGEIIWNSNDTQTRKSQPTPQFSGFLRAVFEKSSDVLKEVAANPNKAAENGTATTASVLTALCLAKFTDSEATSKSSKALVPLSLFARASTHWDGKPSYLLNHRVYTKINTTADLKWTVRALFAVLTFSLNTSVTLHPEFQRAWCQAVLYLLICPTVHHQVSRDTARELTHLHSLHPQSTAEILTLGIRTWLRQWYDEEKESVPVLCKAPPEKLRSALSCIYYSHPQSGWPQVDSNLGKQLADLLVLARQELIPRTSWIDLCLKTNVDPGALVEYHLSTCMDQIVEVTNNAAIQDSVYTTKLHSAAYAAAADLAFVYPSVAIPAIVKRLQQDLDPLQLADINDVDAAIFRSPEGTTYVDVLSTKSNPNPLSGVNKNAKDYDVQKWEEELRAQLAKKSVNLPRKLTAEEQNKVKAQLVKESDIRRRVAVVFASLKRGVGIVSALASTSDRTQPERWIVQAIELLRGIIDAGAGLVLGDLATNAYLACAENVTPRLGGLRVFIGVAFLQAIGVTRLAEEMVSESLPALVTRVLYRLRFVSEQMPFDVVSLAYVLPLVLLVLNRGGIFEKSNTEQADEQLVLTLEFLSVHAEQCANKLLPRQNIISTMISAMQRFNQHYKLVKDCLHVFVANISPTISTSETKLLLQTALVPQVSVRTAVLQAINNDLDLSEYGYSEEIWIASHDIVPEVADLAQTIWAESYMAIDGSVAVPMLRHLTSSDRQLREATAYACADTVSNYWKTFADVLATLKNMYIKGSKPNEPVRDAYGLVNTRNAPAADPWQTRSGVALTLKALATKFDKDELISITQFAIAEGLLGDKSDTVRDEMIEAFKIIVQKHGAAKVEELMKIFETALEDPGRKSRKEFDRANEAVIILYGTLAGHLKSGDPRVPTVVDKLLDAVNTDSEDIQYAVAQGLPSLIRLCPSKTSDYVQRMLQSLLTSKSYGVRRGSAYGLAGLVQGAGIAAVKQFRVMTSLNTAVEAKKDQIQRQGAFLAYELFSTMLGRLFEPYVLEIVPQLLTGMGDSSTDVRGACFEASRACVKHLSSYGVKLVLPMLLDGLEESQWRSKRGACELVGAMAHLDPEQLAQNLPRIIPPLARVLNDSHKEVKAAANRSLQRFGDVLTNPEIKGIVDILLKALSDPTKYTDDALDALIKIQFAHYLDASSLALVARILERGLNDRSLTKRKASQIIGSLAHLTERRDLTAHLPILVTGLRGAIVDPVPETRATASKAMGSLIEKLGEETLPELIPNLMDTLKTDTGAGDRLGSAQALSEVLAGLGTTRLEEALPTILQNVTSTKASVREGFMSLFIFLPACFGNSFANYLSKIIPPILGGLADDVEAIRETALRAGRLLVKNFSSRAIDLLLPSLEAGLADINHRIRLSSVQLVGDLLFNLTGIAGKEAAEEEETEHVNEAGQSLLEVLGEERRNRVLSALYICRCDTSGLVRTAANVVWKALVATPRTLREIIPTLTQVLIIRLASSNLEQKEIAGNAMGELVRKAGDDILATLLPTLDEGLQSSGPESRQGICIALRDAILASSLEAVEEYEASFISTVKAALVDSNSEVREAAAEAFDQLQNKLGKKAVDQVLPSLLTRLRNPDDAENALSALLTLLTNQTRSNIILPTLLPTLLESPINSFNAQAIASLAEVASTAMVRRLSAIINSLVNNIIACKTKDDERLGHLASALDSVLVSVDEDDGLNTMMNVMLTMATDADHHKRKLANVHLATFLTRSEIDISRYYQELIRVFLVLFDDTDLEVVKAAWSALNQLTSKRLPENEMKDLVGSTRQVLLSVGVAGANLKGFGIEKGIGALLPIFVQGLTQGNSDQRREAALGIGDMVDRPSVDQLKPFILKITGPLIRIVSEKPNEVKAAILLTVYKMLEKMALLLKPFVPQLQRTFVNALADTSDDEIRTRGAKCLGTLIPMVQRVDPLINELINKVKAGADQGVKNAICRALYEVVTKTGSPMQESSCNTILGVIDSGSVSEEDDRAATFNARLLGALIKVLPAETSRPLLQNRVLTQPPTKASMYALNAALVDAPELLTGGLLGQTVEVLEAGLSESNDLIATSAVLAVGKLFLLMKEPDATKVAGPLIKTLAELIGPGASVDVRRLSLVVVRTLSRKKAGLLRPRHLGVLVPPIFACVRDTVLPIKLAAEQAFLALFDTVEREGVVFDQYMADHGGSMAAMQKRSLTDYFKRVVLRLAGQALERREAEWVVAGTLGLSEDEVEDEKEVWSVGTVEMETSNNSTASNVFINVFHQLCHLYEQAGKGGLAAAAAAKAEEAVAQAAEEEEEAEEKEREAEEREEEAEESDDRRDSQVDILYF